MPVMNMFPGGSTLQIPLEACTAFSASAGNAQVELTWTDPLDKYATPEGDISDTGDQLVSEWDHTVLVRKTGSQPAGPNDGTVVVSSSVRNQYQSTPYTDTGLTNDTTYYYGVFAYNKDGVASPGAFTTATPKAGTPISSLAVGTLIKINENGAPVEYLIVNQGLPSSMYDASCDGCWVLRKDIYTTSAWDSWNNDYKNSDIHSYLNGTFLNLFDNGIKNIIKQVKIPYQNGDGDGSIASGANGLSCKIFLLSGYELGWTTSNNGSFPHDGAKLSYFSSGTGSAANNKRIANYDGSATRWWLRSPDTGSTSRAWGVDSDGSYDYWFCNGAYGVRPGLILPSTITVDENLNVIVPSSTALQAA